MFLKIVSVFIFWNLKAGTTLHGVCVTDTQNYQVLFLKARSQRDDLLPPPIPQKKRDASPVFVRIIIYFFLF